MKVRLKYVTNYSNHGNEEHVTKSSNVSDWLHRVDLSMLSETVFLYCPLDMLSTNGSGQNARSFANVWVQTYHTGITLVNIFMCPFGTSVAESMGLTLGHFPNVWF